MEALRTFLNSLDTSAQESFAKRCRTSVGYIRKVLSTGERFGESLVISFEKESGGAVRCEDIRPDVDWAYLRNSRHSASPTTRRAG